MPNQPDPCHNSISFLCNQISKHFDRPADFAPWYLDAEKSPPSTRPIDAILFGSFFERFLEVDSWPPNDFRLWTISSRAKKVMTELLGIPADYIGLIPRWSFPKNHTPRPPVNKDWNLVYAGRISPNKNIEAIIWLSYFLQKHFNPKITLHLFGNFDNWIHPEERSIWYPNDYKTHLLDLIASLQWQTPPQITTNLSPYEWTQKLPANPVMISLSTFFHEDFGVALWQGEDLGLPLIASNWGGHGDICDNYLLPIPMHLIGRSTTPRPLIETQSMLLADFIWQHDFSLKGKRFSESAKNIPTVCTKAELQSWKETFISKYSFELPLDHLPKTPGGRAVLSQYANIFANKNTATDAFILVNDFHQSDNPYLKNITSNTMIITKELYNKNFNWSYLDFRDVTFPHNIMALSQSREIYFPCIFPGCDKILRLLTCDLQVSSKIIIFATEYALSKMPKLKDLLRTTDLIKKY